MVYHGNIYVWLLYYPSWLSISIWTIQHKYNFNYFASLLNSFFRDFRLGENIDDEICKHMSESKMHIVVLSKNFIKKHWPLQEFRIAFDDYIKRDKVMVIIMLGDIERQELPQFAQKMLPTTVYLEWETDESDSEYVHIVDNAKYKLFWAKLLAKLYGIKNPFYSPRPCCCKPEFNAGNIDQLWHDRMPLVAV